MMAERGGFGVVAQRRRFDPSPYHQHKTKTTMYEEYLLTPTQFTMLNPRDKQEAYESLYALTQSHEAHITMLRNTVSAMYALTEPTDAHWTDLLDTEVA